MIKTVTVAKASDILPGKIRALDVDGVRIALCNANGTFYAIEDVCTHDDGPLDQGNLSGHEVECPRHGARFDVRTGAVTRMPAVVPVRKFPVRIEGDSVLVEVEVP